MGRQVGSLIGQRFGKLTVIAQAELYISPRGHKAERWLCRCDCGKEKIVMRGHLCSGATTSCGCLVSEKTRKRNTTHGLTYTILYRIWRGIISRCNIPSASGYENYGGRGITVCEEWHNDFQAFYEWAYANGYKEEILPNGRSKWTIDRIDVNGNYEPSNCRWITVQGQSNNRRSNYPIEYNGRTQTIAEWAKELGINYHTLHDRLLVHGWSVEKALKTPPEEYRHKKTV